MKLTVLQENLSAATAAAVRVATNSPYLIMASMVLLETLDNDALQVTATNGNDTAILRVAAALVEESGGVAVPAKLLNEIVSLLPSGAVELEAIGERRDVLMITAPKNTSRLHGHPPQALTSIIEHPADTQPLMTLTYGQLRYISSAVGSAAAKDTAREALTGILFDSDGRQLKVVATNGFRLALHQVRMTGEKWRLLLPVKSLATFLATAGHLADDDPVSIAANDFFAVFSAPGIEFTMQRIRVQYPNVDSFLSRKKKTAVVVDGSELKRMLVMFTKQKGGGLQLTEKDGVLELALNIDGLQSGDVVKSELPFTRTGDGDALNFSLSPVYFMDAVRAIPDLSGGVAIELDDAQKPVNVRGADDMDNLSVVMPMIGGR